MTLRTALLLARVVTEFFTYEAAWAASSTMKALFFSRIFLLTVPMAALIVVCQTAVVWTQQQHHSDGLVLQREFRQEQERNREVHKELKEEVEVSRKILYELMISQARDEEFKKRIEGRLNDGMWILWSMCSLLIVQVIIPLMRLGLRREIARSTQERGQ